MYWGDPEILSNISPRWNLRRVWTSWSRWKTPPKRRKNICYTSYFSPVSSVRKHDGWLLTAYYLGLSMDVLILESHDAFSTGSQNSNVDNKPMGFWHCSHQNSCCLWIFNDFHPLIEYWINMCINHRFGPIQTWWRTSYHPPTNIDPACPCQIGHVLSGSIYVYLSLLGGHPCFFLCHLSFQLVFKAQTWPQCQSR